MIMNILGNIPAESVNVIVISVTAAIIGLAVLGYLVWNVACIEASNESIEASNDAIRESNYAIKDKLNQIAESLAKKEKQKQEQVSTTVTETSNETKLSDDEMRLIQERKKKNEERIAKAFSRDEEEKK